MMLIVIGIMCLSVQANATKPENLNVQAHTIFQPLYSSSQRATTQSHASMLKKIYDQISEIVDLPLGDDFHLKLSRVRAGPIDKKTMQLLDHGVAIQTHEGFNTKRSKGYGIEFSYRFN